MKPRVQSALLVVLALSTVIATGFAVQRGRALAALRFSLNDDNHLDRGSLESRLADAERRARALENELAALKPRHASNAEAGEPPPPPTGDGPFRVDGGPRRGRDGMAVLMDSPEFAQLMRVQQLGALDSRYADLFKKLVISGKLSPEQLQAFKDLLIEQQNTRRDVMMSARQQGISDRSQIDALTKSAQGELDAQIQSTLGTDAYAEYQQYAQTATQRRTVSQIEQNLSYTSTPLTAQQSEQLVQALYAASSTTSQAPTGASRGGGPLGGAGGGGGVRITDTMVTAAQSILTPAQLQAIVTLQQQQQAEQAMMRKVRDSRQSNAAAASGK